MKTGLIADACMVLANVKLTKLNLAEKTTAIKAFRAIKEASKSFDDLLAVAREKLKPEGWDALHARRAELTGAERRRYIELTGIYNDEVTLSVREEQEREQELSYARLSAEAIDKLIESNDLPLAQLDLLQTALGEEA